MLTMFGEFDNSSLPVALDRQPNEPVERSQKQKIAHFQPYLDNAVKFSIKSTV